LLKKFTLAFVCVLAFISIVFSFTPIVSKAEALNYYARQSPDVDDSTTNDLVDKRVCLLRYGYFTEEGMNEAYTDEYGFIVSIGGEDLINYEQKKGVWWGVRLETGLLMSEGEPLKKYSKFDKVDEKLSMFSLPLSMTMMRQLSDFNRSDVMTYWGLGFGFFLGFERMECHVTKQTTTSVYNYEWHDTCYRHSFAGHGLLGINWNVSEKFSFLCELRWTQGGKGRLERAELTEQQILNGFEEVFEDYQHPDFNFTGASLDIGIKW